jgi:SAM-dependent methyltransferase
VPSRTSTPGPRVLDAATVYARSAAAYASTRRADLRILAALRNAIGDDHPIVNVGAGTGSYEDGLGVDLAVEPAPAMIARRPASAAPCLRASAEALPIRDGAVGVATALLTIHHWSDWRAGLRELRRMARRKVVVFTWDPAFQHALWLGDYLPPDLLAWDAGRFPSPDDLGGESTAVAIRWDCTDGFMGAYWRRPEAYLDPTARAGISALAQAPPDVIDPAMERLATDLASGAWAARHGHLLAREELDLGYRIVTLPPSPVAP